MGDGICFKDPARHVIALLRLASQPTGARPKRQTPRKRAGLIKKCQTNSPACQDIGPPAKDKVGVLRDGILGARGRD
jgi:hypothetical protein